MILITGGSGFLGKAVSARIPEARALSSRDLDLTDGAKVAEAIGDWKPDVVVHLAARVGGITANIAQQADFLIDNLRMDANVLAAVRDNPPRHLISMLSTCMYPDRLPDTEYPMTEAVIEAGPPPPTNAAYAAAKRALWQGTRALHSQYSVPYTALVPANLYGPNDHFGDDHSHFLAAAIHRIESARVDRAPWVEFFGTGTALRQYVLADDVARLVRVLIDRGPTDETLNIAPTENRTIKELAATVGRVSGYQGEIRFDGNGPDGQFRKDVTSELLRDLVPEWLDIETPLETGLQHTIEWYREHVATS